jgi:hypothetical protein
VKQRVIARQIDHGGSAGRSHKLLKQFRFPRNGGTIGFCTSIWRRTAAATTSFGTDYNVARFWTNRPATLISILAAWKVVGINGVLIVSVMTGILSTGHAAFVCQQVVNDYLGSLSDYARCLVDDEKAKQGQINE